MARWLSLEEIGRRIRKSREARGWTGKRLATEIGTDKGTISRLERGEAGLSVDRLQRIANALEIEPNELLRREVATSRPSALCPR